MLDYTVGLSHLSLIFSILGLVMASYVLSEQIGLRKNLKLDQRKREKSSAKFLLYDLFEPTVNLEQMVLIENEIAEIRDKSNADERIQNRSNEFSSLQDEVKENMSKINKVLLLTKDDVIQDLFEEIYWLIKELEDWDYDPRIPETTRIGELPSFTASYFSSKLEKVYNKLEKIAN